MSPAATTLRCPPPSPATEAGTPEQRLVWVLGQQPSAVTWAVLETCDVALPVRCRVLAARAWERQRAAVTAWSTAAKVSATVRKSPSPDDQDAADTELALALRRTDHEIAYELACDRRLVQFPSLYAVLAVGDTAHLGMPMRSCG